MLAGSIRVALCLIVAANISFGNPRAPAQAQPGAGPSATNAGEPIYSQPPNASGGLFASSRWDQVGSDYDQYVWESFTLQSTQAITEVQWRGGYDMSYANAGPLTDFTVAIYASTAGGAQPDVNNPLILRT